MEKRSDEELRDTMKELIKFTHMHFQYEETIFKKIKYPHEEFHRMEHTAFLGRCLVFENKVSTRNIALSMDMMEFLKNWLLEHILVEDRKYVEEFRKNNVG